MSFKDIIEGKESKVESHLKVDEDFLRKLAEYKIITNFQRWKIGVYFCYCLQVLVE